MTLSFPKPAVTHSNQQFVLIKNKPCYNITEIKQTWAKQLTFVLCGTFGSGSFRYSSKHQVCWSFVFSPTEVFALQRHSNSNTADRKFCYNLFIQYEVWQHSLSGTEKKRETVMLWNTSFFPLSPMRGNVCPEGLLRWNVSLW